jgi:hypothetical protein
LRSINPDLESIREGICSPVQIRIARIGIVDRGGGIRPGALPLDGLLLRDTFS